MPVDWSAARAAANCYFTCVQVLVVTVMVRSLSGCHTTLDLILLRGDIDSDDTKSHTLFAMSTGLMVNKMC